MAQARTPRKGRLSLLLRVLASALLMGLVIRQVDWGVFAATVKAADPFYLSLSLLVSPLLVLVSAWKWPQWVKELGILALTFGILGQIIGLFTGFSAIEQAPDISPAMLAGGLKVSTITSLFGFLIFIVSLIIRIVHKPRLQ